MIFPLSFQVVREPLPFAYHCMNTLPTLATLVQAKKITGSCLEGESADQQIAHSLENDLYSTICQVHNLETTL